MCKHFRVPPFAKNAKDGAPILLVMPARSKSWANGRCVQISRMTIVITRTSYFACASFVTTAAILSSIWFQPSN
jgi:hypothetical protein